MHRLSLSPKLETVKGTEIVEEKAAYTRGAKLTSPPPPKLYMLCEQKEDIDCWCAIDSSKCPLFKRVLNLKKNCEGWFCDIEFLQKGGSSIVFVCESICIRRGAIISP